jgi:hypothetical protein
MYHGGAVEEAALMFTDTMRTENTTFRTLSPTSTFFFTDSSAQSIPFISANVPSTTEAEFVPP